MDGWTFSMIDSENVGEFVRSAGGICIGYSAYLTKIKNIRNP